MKSSVRHFVIRWWPWMVLALAIVLRMLYVAKTPFNTRSHDEEAHLDYIRYIAQHWSVPPAQGGWEFHQPPLFYFVSALWWALGPALGRDQDMLILDLQFSSFLLSIAIVALSFWIASILFAHERRLERFLTVFLVGVCPGLLIASSLISNDLPSYLLGLAAMGFLLRWYRDGWWKDWYLLALVLALGLLTKLTLILFVPVAVICFLRKRRRKAHGLHHQRRHLAVFFGVIVLLAGWFPLLRALEDQPRNMIPQTEGLNPGILLPTKVSTFLVFNPLKVVQIPYVDPWSDESRRQYFWEYFYRSAFLGEWNFGDTLKLVSQTMLFLGLGLLGFSIRGAVWAVWKERPWWALPVGLSILFLLLGAVGYRMVNTCACSQDFRYSGALALPAAVLVTAGICSLPRLYRRLGVAWVVTFGLAVLVFVTVLPSSR